MSKISKRLLSLVLAVMMIVSMMPTTVFAVDNDAADLTISTVADLKAFADAVNAGNSYEGKLVVLANDIDLEYTAVVIGTKASPFKGIFDGQGHTVDNLSIYENGSDSDYFAGSDDYLGLFGVLNTPGVIKNVTVNNPYIVGSSYVGGIVGMGYTGKIENCHVTGKIIIEGHYMVGGITGHGYARIYDCSVIGEEGWDYSYIGASYKEANLEGDNVGGIVGHNAENNVISGCTVKNVTVSGTRKVGGIVGITAQSTDITDCVVENVTVETTATAEYAADNTKTMSIGGIVGQYMANANGVGGTLSNCTVKDLTFANENGVPVNAGALTGGVRASSGTTFEPAEGNITLSGNTAANVEGETVTYLEPAPSYTVCVGDQGYETLEAAVAAAKDGKTVTLLTNITMTERINIAAGEKLVLDLNGHVIDGVDNVSIAIMSYGDLTIKDTSAAQNGAIRAGITAEKRGNTINICAGTFTLESGTIYSVNNALLIDEEAANIIINGGKLYAEPNTNNSAAMYISSSDQTNVTINDGEMIGFNGILLWNNTTIDMVAGSIDARGRLGIQGNGSKDNTRINISGTASVSGVMAGIYHPQGGELNISGNATITGGTGIVVKGGKVNISGGTISGTGEAVAYKPVNSGFEGTGDGLYVEHYDNSANSENYGTPVVSVTGGTFTSANGKAVASYANTGMEALSGFISGGKFSSNVSDYCADGFETTDEDGDGIYEIAEDGLKGSGTQADPFVIDSVEDLILFRDSVNAGEGKYNNAYVILTDDIDLSSVTNWTPIGNVNYDTKYIPVDATKVFSGVFDGNGKVISNLAISKTVGGVDTQANVGLFGITGAGAVIKDLTLTNVNITTDGRNVGALAGFAYKATLENITVNGNIQIKGGNNTAGVCGMTRYFDMSATNISVSGNAGSAIIGNNIVGGIFAEIAPDGSTQTFKNLSVENIAITGASGVGGIVGLLTLGTVDTVSVKNVVLTGRTDYQGDAMGRIRLGSVAGLLGNKFATVINATVENVTAKNLDGNAVELPIVGANYDSSSNATEAKVGDTYYKTFADALAAAKTGDTIELLADIEFAENAASIVIDKAITIDGNGANLVFDSATSAFVIKSGGVTFTDMTITQGTKDNSFHISVDKGPWNAPAIRYTNITIKNINFEGGDYALCLIGENIVVDSCTFTGQDSHNIIVYSLKGDSKITNNIFNASKGSNKSAILYEGGADNATDLSGFMGGGKLTVSGNEAYDKGVFFQFTNWGLVKDMTLGITDNKVDGTTNKVIAFYDMDGAVTAAGNEFASVIINENVFTNTKADRPIIKEYTGTVSVDATGNYLGSAEPDIAALLLGDQMTCDGYYTTYVNGVLGGWTGINAYVAEVNGQGFASLGDAIVYANTITDGVANIKLLSDVEFGGAYIYTNMVLDLNGHVITATGDYIFTLNPGTLTVKDSSAEKTGKIDGSATVGNAFIVYGGALTIESGIIHANNNVIFTYTSSSTITINGGELKSVIATGNILYLCEANTKTTVNGGTFYGPIASFAGTLEITGGQFATDVSAYCVYGKTTQLVGGMYQVVDAQKNIYIGENSYLTLEEALNAAKDGDTIEIRAAGSYQLKRGNLSEGAYYLPKNLTIKGTVEGVVVTNGPTIRCESITIDNIDFINPSTTGTSSGLVFQISGDSQITNCTMDGYWGGSYYSLVDGSLVIDNCVITGVVYGLNISEVYDSDITITNTKISGFTTFDSKYNVVLDGCELTHNGNYGYLGFYNDATINNCTFGPGMEIGSQTSKPLTIYINNSSAEAGKEIADILVPGTIEANSIYVDGVLLGAKYVIEVELSTGEIYQYTAENIDDASDVLGSNTNADATITLLDDVTTGKWGLGIGCYWTVVDGAIKYFPKNVEIDLNGYTLNGHIEINANVTATVKNGSVVNTDKNFAGIIVGGDVTLENVTVDSVSHAVRVNDGKLTVISGTYKVSGAKGTTAHAVYAYGTSEVTIKGGEFIGPKGGNGSDGSAIYVAKNATVSVNGGTFTKGNTKLLGVSGTLSLTGGTYDQDPGAYCAKGYAAVDNGDGTYGIKVQLPEVVITDIKDSLTGEDPDLTFALNFSIGDLENLTEEYLEALLEAYGDYYVDYVMTITGLADGSVTFYCDLNGNVEEGADGYLAGQYDAFGDAWVPVPFNKAVTVNNGDSLYIMEYAAKLMGKTGLRFTLAEVAAIVQNFDCGVYFTPEFLAANPDLEVSLELKVFTEDAEGNKIEDISVATNEFENNYAAAVSGEGKQTVYYATFAEALAAAQAGDTVELLADVKLTGKLTMTKSVTIDGNGHSIIADETAVWYTTGSKPLYLKQYKTHLLGINANNITLKDIVLDCNNNAAGINVYCAQNVVFDNVSIINATKGMAALTVNGSTLTAKSALTITGNAIAIDVSNGSGVTSALGMTVEEGTVFDLGNKTVKFASIADIDLTNAVKEDGTAYFAAMDNAYCYTQTQMESRTTGYSNGLKLLDDVTLNKAITVNGTLDLNGYDLTVDELKVSGKTTITGEGAFAGDVTLTSASATLTAPADMEIASGMDGYVVLYENGAYKLVQINYIAEVNGTKCETFAEIWAAVKANSEAGIDVTVKFLSDLELAKSEYKAFDYGTGNITFTADKPVTITLKMDFDFAEGQNITIKVESNVTLNVYDNAGGMYVFYGPGLLVEGTIGGGQNWGCLYLAYGEHKVTEVGQVLSGRVHLAWTKLTVNGLIDTNYLLVEDTILTLDGAVVDADYFTDTNNGDLRYDASEIYVINGSVVKAGKAELKHANSVLTIDLTSTLTANTFVGAGKIVIDASGFNGTSVQVITADMSGFTGNIEVINADDATYEITDTGVIVKKAVKTVAQIGDVKYESLEAALDAAKAAGMTEVTVQLLDDCKFSTKVKDFTKITFVGTDRAQTLDLNLNAAVELGSVELVFEDLTVSRLDKDWLYHYFYAGKITYTDCDMIGLFNVTAQDTDFIGCDFYNDDTFGDGQYSLWVYNCHANVEVNVVDCTFDVYERAIKMYGDGYTGSMVLNVKGTSFVSRTADKTVVEIAQDNNCSNGKFTLNVENITYEGFGAYEHTGNDSYNTLFNVEVTSVGGTVEVYKDSTKIWPMGQVAVNLQTGVKYEDVQEALNAAAKGDTIQLLTDVTAEFIYVGVDKTLDLNGNKLTAGTVSASFTTSYIIDSIGGGLLIVAKENISLNKGNKQLPIWTAEGAIFEKFGFNQRLTSSDDGSVATFDFYINKIAAETQLDEYLVNGTLTLRVKATWTSSKGTVSTQYFEIPVETIQGMINSEKGWDSAVFYLKLRGVEDVTNLTLTAEVVSTANSQASVIVSSEPQTRS